MQGVAEDKCRVERVRRAAAGGWHAGAELVILDAGGFQVGRQGWGCEADGAEITNQPQLHGSTHALFAAQTGWHGQQCAPFHYQCLMLIIRSLVSDVRGALLKDSARHIAKQQGSALHCTAQPHSMLHPPCPCSAHPMHPPPPWLSSCSCRTASSHRPRLGPGASCTWRGAASAHTEPGGSCLAQARRAVGALFWDWPPATAVRVLAWQRQGACSGTQGAHINGGGSHPC